MIVNTDTPSTVHVTYFDLIALRRLMWLSQLWVFEFGSGSGPGCEFLGKFHDP